MLKTKKKLNVKKKDNNKKENISKNEKNILSKSQQIEISKEKIGFNCFEKKNGLSIIKFIFDIKEKLIHFNNKKNGKILFNLLVKNAIASHLIDNDKRNNKKRLSKAFNKYKNICLYEKILGDIKSKYNLNERKNENLIITKTCNNVIANRIKRKDNIINKVIDNFKIKNNADNAKSFIITKKINNLQIIGCNNKDTKENIQIMPTMSIAIIKEEKLTYNKFENAKCIITKENKLSLNKSRPCLRKLEVTKVINNLNIVNGKNNLELRIVKLINKFSIKRTNKLHLILNKVEKFSIKPTKRVPNNLYISYNVNNLLIEATKNENALYNGKLLNKFINERIITKVKSLNLIAKKSKEYIITKNKNYSIEGKIVTAKKTDNEFPSKNQKNLIIIKVNKNFYIKGIKKVCNEPTITKVVDKFNVRGQNKQIKEKMNNYIITKVINKFHIVNNKSEDIIPLKDLEKNKKFNIVDLIITKVINKLNIYGNKNNEMIVTKNISVSVKKNNNRNQNELVITKTKKFSIDKENKQYEVKRDNYIINKVNNFYLSKSTKTLIAHFEDNSNVIVKVQNVSLIKNKKDDYAIEKKNNFYLEKKQRVIEIDYSSNIAILIERDEEKFQSTENKLKKVLLPIKLKNILLKINKKQTLQTLAESNFCVNKKQNIKKSDNLIINRVIKLEYVDRKENGGKNVAEKIKKEGQNKEKKIILRFQTVKILKKRREKNVFQPVVQKIQLKNILRRNFILWKKITEAEKMKSNFMEKNEEKNGNVF